MPPNKIQCIFNKQYSKKLHRDLFNCQQKQLTPFLLTILTLELGRMLVNERCIEHKYVPGGTLAIQARYFEPATVTVHVPHSPFLHLVGTLNPSLVQAAINDEPGSASILLPLATNGVLALNNIIDDDALLLLMKKLSAHQQATTTNNKTRNIFSLFKIRLFSCC